MNRKLKTKQEYYIKRFMELPTTIIGCQEIKYAKQYIEELEENSGVLVSQVESWSKSSDDYLEKYQELHNKIDKVIKIMEDYTLFSLSAEKVMKIINILKDSDVDE